MTSILNFCKKTDTLQPYSCIGKSITNGNFCFNTNSSSSGTGFQVLNSDYNLPVFGIGSFNNRNPVLDNRMDTTSNGILMFWRRCQGNELLVDDQTVIIPEWDGSNEEEIFFLSDLIVPDARALTILAVLKNLNPDINTVMINRMSDENFEIIDSILDEGMAWISKITPTY